MNATTNADASSRQPLSPAPGARAPLSPPKPPVRPPSLMSPATPVELTASSGAQSDAPRVQSLLADLASTRRQLGEKEAALQAALRERDTARAGLVEAERAHQESNTALERRITELESALSAEKKPSAEQAGLRRIRGIGPAYERALLGLGITRVGQVAALSPADIERIAPLIKATPERILRDDWVGQATRLAAD